MAFSNMVTAAVVVGISAYLYFGGRASVAIVLFISYGIFYTEQNKPEHVESDKNELDSKSEPLNKEVKKHVCACGGSGGCGSKSNTTGEKKKGCCGGKGGCGGHGGHSHEHGHSHSHEHGHDHKHGDTREDDSSSDEKDHLKQLDDLTIDFTGAFNTAHNTKKPLNKVPKRVPKYFNKDKKADTINDANDGLIKSAFTISNEKLLKSDVYVFYSSLQGAAEQAAKIVESQLQQVKELEKEPILVNLDELDNIDDYFIDVPSKNALYVIVLPSYDVDCPLDYFLQTMEENFFDSRLERYPLRKLVGYTVLGLGDSESWPDKFCYQAKKTDNLMAKLGGRRIFPTGEICMKTKGNPAIESWGKLLGEMLKDDEPILYEYDEAVSNEADQDEDEEESEIDINSDDEQLADVEDLAGSDSDKKSNANKNLYEVKQMVAKNSPTYKTLTKQGYKIVGSHSGVKVCRWTKNELRGRGSCYKKSLFNIASSRCMELTPSLACSSKCVFCWRHGTNPVSKNWRWEVDEPEFILENALIAHYSMIKQMRGVPGVVAERFAKAFKVAHCALSLVGEPILYPYISKFIELLHQKDITSFLVCNAQHPESLRTIGRVTQLYVSIDASTKQELKKVDRPLYKDFWERMMECLDIIRTVQSHQRTVFRLTLVKGFNMGDISSYADLVARGLPCFIEVKGATFSGSSKDNVNSLTMQNIPYNEECKNFVENFVAELQRRGLNYEVAAEHAHSNCILIADSKFKINGEWHTHIAFEKFFELLKSGKDFTYMDYLEKTPEWALYGNGGFAPGNERVIRKEKKLKNKLLREQESLKSETSSIVTEETTTSEVPLEA
ncbi:S-adenosyl-L-methionine-dependent tRNA 4-demethylwyosine synthase [Monosporozyma servazzii]